MSAALARVPSVLRSRKTLDKVGTMLAVRVASMGVIKQLDINHPQTVVRVRYVFFAVQLVALLVFVYILFRVGGAVAADSDSGEERPDEHQDETVPHRRKGKGYRHKSRDRQGHARPQGGRTRRDDCPRPRRRAGQGGHQGNRAVRCSDECRVNLLWLE